MHIPKQGFGRNFFNFRAKHQQGFGRNLYQPSGETLNDLRSSLVLRMLGQMYYELFEWCGHGYSSTNTFISWLPPPCVRQEGHKPLAEYTRRILSNIRSYGGVCIMPTTIVRVVSVIVRERNSCFYQFVSANHTYTVNNAQA